MKPFVLFLILLGMTLAIDAVWLTLNYSYHKALFAAIQGSPLTIRYLPAFLVYVVIAAALWYFVFDGGKEKNPALLRAFILGLLMYGIYDLTNYATLARYTLRMTVTDSLWGATLFTLVTWVVSRINI
jgi:uncharacterized membrane protein